MSEFKLKFQLICENTNYGENVFLVGNSSSIGNWNINNSEKLYTDSNRFPLWESNIINFKSKGNIEYKYIIKSQDNNNIKWESFPGNRFLDFSNLKNNEILLINDGEFSNLTNPKITKILTEDESKNKNSNKKNLKEKNKEIKLTKETKKENINKYISTNAEQYVQSRRDEIKNFDNKNNYKFNNSEIKVSKEIENFINILTKKNSEENTWRKKLSFTCELIEQNESNGQIISLIATYLYFVNSGQIKCSEDGTHFRPNHSAKHAFNIFKKLYKKIFSNSERINENSFSIVARSILRNLPSFNEQFMVQVPLTRIRDIAHRSDIPHELKQEIKHKLQNKLHRNASPDDLIVCEYFINKIKDENYSDDFKKEFNIFYDELKEFFNSSGLEKVLDKFKDISEENASQTQRIINCLKSNDLVKKIESITEFRENICCKINYIEMQVLMI